jgi:hypothetical protein
VKTDGTAVAWGLNDAGQLDNRNRTNQTRPVAMYGVTRAAQLAAGRGYTMALLTA